MTPDEWIAATLASSPPMLLHHGTVRRRILTRAEWMPAASALRLVLKSFPAGNDSSLDSSVRRRLEGAVIALDLASGKTPNPPDH
jgi:hypothetical protein